jgi:hypothetical protein
VADISLYSHRRTGNVQTKSGHHTATACLCTRNIYSFSANLGSETKWNQQTNGERMLGTVKLLIIFADYVQCGFVSGVQRKRPRLIVRLPKRHTFCASFYPFFLSVFPVASTMCLRLYSGCVPVHVGSPHSWSHLNPVCIVVLSFSARSCHKSVEVRCK